MLDVLRNMDYNEDIAWKKLEFLWEDEPIVSFQQNQSLSKEENREKASEFTMKCCWSDKQKRNSTGDLEPQKEHENKQDISSHSQNIENEFDEEQNECKNTIMRQISIKQDEEFARLMQKEEEMMIMDSKQAEVLQRELDDENKKHNYAKSQDNIKAKKKKNKNPFQNKIKNS